MKTFIITASAVALLTCTAVFANQDKKPQEKPAAQDAPQMPDLPGPVAEHEWLQQLAGEWTSTMKGEAGPDWPGFEAKGTESIRSIGGFWIIAENHGDMMGMPYTGVLTLGYDSEKKKYVGTWIDSMTSYMWTYEGTREGDTLTLNTTGPNPENPGETIKFRESIQVKGKDHKVFTSTMQGEDGKWSTMMTIDYARKQ